MSDKLDAALNDLTMVVQAAHPDTQEEFLTDCQRLDERNATEGLIARLKTIEPSISHKESDDFYRDALRMKKFPWQFIGLQGLVLLVFAAIAYFNLSPYVTAIPLLGAIAIGGFYLTPALSLVGTLRRELAASHLKQAYNILKK